MSRESRAGLAPRRAALEALTAVAAGRRLEAALAAALEKIGPDPRDRALAMELAYGVQRWRGWLDAVLAGRLSRPLEKTSPLVLDILRLGAHQMLKMDRVPAFAAVDTCVELAKDKSPRQTGLVNAVLRKLAATPREGLAAEVAAGREDPADRLAAVHSHPGWLARLWLNTLGQAEAEALLAADNQPPEPTLRANVLAGGREALLAALAAAGVNGHPATHAPQGVVVPGLTADRLAEVAPGLAAAQSEAAQLVAPLLDPPAGGLVVDLCAGAGGKTSHLAELMGDRGQLVALDRSAARLEFNRTLCRRLGISCVSFLAADALRPPEELAGRADAVLLDAPCTGLGVLRSRPDGRWRVGPDDPARLARAQGRLLDSAAALLKPGGALVYAVCTLTPEETTGVVGAFLAGRPEFAVDDRRPGWPAGLDGAITPQGFAALWPQRHGLDGFFMARLRRGPREVS